jgi:hypothetical protein
VYQQGKEAFRSSVPRLRVEGEDAAAAGGVNDSAETVAELSPMRMGRMSGGDYGRNTEERSARRRSRTLSVNGNGRG